MYKFAIMRSGELARAANTGLVLSTMSSIISSCSYCCLSAASVLTGLWGLVDC